MWTDSAKPCCVILPDGICPSDTLPQGKCRRKSGHDTYGLFLCPREEADGLEAEREIVIKLQVFAADAWIGVQALERRVARG